MSLAVAVADAISAAFDALHRRMRRDILVGGALSSTKEADPKKAAKWAVEAADYAIEEMNKPKQEKRF